MIRRGKQVVVAVLGSALTLHKGSCCISPSPLPQFRAVLGWVPPTQTRFTPPGLLSSLLVCLLCGEGYDWSTYSVLCGAVYTQLLPFPAVRYIVYIFHFQLDTARIIFLGVYTPLYHSSDHWEFRIFTLF